MTFTPKFVLRKKLYPSLLTFGVGLLFLASFNLGNLLVPILFGLLFLVCLASLLTQKEKVTISDTSTLTFNHESLVEHLSTSVNLTEVVKAKLVTTFSRYECEGHQINL